MSGAGLAGSAGDDAWVPITRPLLPTADQLLPYLRRIDAARFYTNGGLLQHLLHDALAVHFRVGSDRIGLAGSGTAAIAGLLTAVAGRARAERPLCVCPAYTFVATATAAQACGYDP